MLDPQADAFGFGIDFEDLALDFVAHVDELGGVLEALGPRHFRNVNQPFDSIFEFDESAVVFNADDLAFDFHADRELVLHFIPRIGGDLFEAQGDAFFFAIVLENLDFDLIAHRKQFAWVLDAAP